MTPSKTSMKQEIAAVLVVSLILVSVKSSEAATFENVSIIVASSKNKTLESIVFVLSDNYLGKYASQSIKGYSADTVKIENQTVPILHENSVTDLPQVEYLYLNRNKIKEIRPGAFKNLTKLVELSLSDNLLTEIRDGVFDDLPFETLYLDNNQITRIEDKAFNDLRMNYLFIDNNRIGTWESQWFSGTPLTGISISNNVLENLPASSFQYLWQFGVRHYGFSVAYAIFNNNKISKIDYDAFDGIQEVLYLSLQNNSLRYLEPGLFDSVENIHVLELNNNKIEELYFETFRNTKVNEFRLINNQLSCIEVDIFNVTGLNMLYVDGNPITCECVEAWKSWNETKNALQIDNFGSIEEQCVIKSIASTSELLSVYIVMCMLILLIACK